MFRHIFIVGSVRVLQIQTPFRKSWGMGCDYRRYFCSLLVWVFYLSNRSGIYKKDWIKRKSHRRKTNSVKIYKPKWSVTNKLQIHHPTEITEKFQNTIITEYYFICCVYVFFLYYFWDFTFSIVFILLPLYCFILCFTSNLITDICIIILYIDSLFGCICVFNI